MKIPMIIMACCLTAGGAAAAPPVAYLFVSSVPGSASVTVNGTPAGTTPCKIAIIPDNGLIVSVARTGYVTQRRTVAATGAVTNLDVSLEPATGSLRITSDPDGGAIYLNGNPAGTAPLRIDNIRCGTYDIRLTSDGYADYRTSVTVSDTDPAAVHAVFAEFGALFIESNPLNAAVYVDGALKGRTPLKLTDLTAGQCAVRVEHAGYRPYRSTVTVYDNTLTSVQAELEAGFGALAITSVPSGAAVTVNGMARGVTPVTLNRLPFGTHRVGFALAGHMDTVLAVSIENSTGGRLHTLLRPKPSQLRITTGVTGAEILIDGQRPEPDHGAYRLPAGTHTVSISHPDYAPVIKQMTLEPGTAVDLHLPLIRHTRRGTVLQSLLVPGWGQYRAGHTEKAFFIWALQGAGLTAAVITAFDAAGAGSTYRDKDDAYYDGPDDATYAERETAYDDLKTKRTRALITAGIAAAVWGLNVADAAFTPYRSATGFAVAPAVLPGALLAGTLTYRF